ncbi:MAG: Rpn family recombination-promoting nuclease/putative transposase [Butyrivibrio sp.]|uniref:Rpn family recombination-promoting nuclease/putative transposase n=1 Tax=Butyrivibrio sp. TaxID=28121 RepID=UPI001B7867F5|nr:Rpn family recombination-promoting nuclease/putative transposase [Butyrivibrio sp.]MBP3784621.1 Rpn family recombination-promoting nuclease/putative transposase [Butyrivibrio sp.]
MNNKKEIINEFTGKDYLNATGDIPYGMMNDYIFRIVFQKNKYALKGLLCSLLGLEDDRIVGLRIVNEVTPGVRITDKEYRLDIVVELDDGTTIDLEMQKDNYDNWQYRSLSYLCREFDSLDHGEDYSEVKPVYQVGFLDFTLFEDHPEFFGKYQLRNARDNYLYTDRFNLIVVSLNQIKLATSDDIACGIDQWARLFKSKTWEDIKMVASNNKYMTSAVETVYLTNEDKNAIKIAREREDFIRLQAYKDAKLKELEESNAAMEAKIASKEAEITSIKAENADKDATIADKDAEIARLKAELDNLKNR